MQRKRLWLAALVLLALVLALPLLLNLDIFLEQVHRAVERQIGRSVEFSSLTAQLLPRPGFVGRRVMVYGREEFGAEPVLYADEVSCDLALRSLWTFRLEFSEIHFEHPSLNIVRSPAGTWNLVAPLLAGAATADRPRMPALSTTDARINFKIGPDKLVYALIDARLRLVPLDAGRWHLTLDAVPVRSDRRLTETGRVHLEGDVGPAPGASTLAFKLNASLDSGSLAQLWAFGTGHEPPIRAQAAFATSVEGTPAHWDARGTVALTNLRRWDLLAAPASPHWSTDFDVSYHRAGPSLEVKGFALRVGDSQLDAAGTVDDPLGARRWNLTITSKRLDLSDVLTQLSGLQAGISSDARLNGAAQMQLVAHGPWQSWSAQMILPEKATAHIPGLAHNVDVSGLDVHLAGGKLQLAPLALQFSADQRLTLSGDADLTRPDVPYHLHWESAGLDLSALRRLTAAAGWNLFGPTRWQGGARINLDWQGELLSGSPPQWQGVVQLANVKYQPPEINQALDISQARLEWKGPRLTVKPIVARFNDRPLTASLDRQGSVGGWNLSVDADQLALDDVDSLVNPARQGLLTRLVRLGPQVERRWNHLLVAAEFHVANLTAGPFRLQRVEAKGEWQSGWLDVTRLRFQAYGGKFDGRLQADFRVSPPQYRLAGNVKELRLNQLVTGTTALGNRFRGLVGVDLSLHSEGTQPHDLLQNLDGRVVGVVQNGTFSGFNLLQALSAAAGVSAGPKDATAPTQLQSLAGEFRIAQGQVEFDRARLIISRASLELSGKVGFDGGVDLRLQGQPLRFGGRRPTANLSQVLSSSYQLTGTLDQPQVKLLEPAPTPTP